MLLCARLLMNQRLFKLDMLTVAIILGSVVKLSTSLASVQDHSAKKE